jgi:anti-anti-sigma regulatory factor
MLPCRPRSQGTEERLTSTNEPRCAASDGGSRRPAAVPPGWVEAVAHRDAQSPLQVRFSRPPATLRFDGTVDESTRALLHTALARAAASAQDTLRIDVTGVTFCDLPGLRAIVSLARQLAPDGHVTLAGLPHEARTILHILGWDATPGLAVLPARPPHPDGQPHPEGQRIGRSGPGTQPEGRWAT